MAPSSGHLSPAEAAPSGSAPSGQPKSTHSEAGRRSPAPAAGPSTVDHPATTSGTYSGGHDLEPGSRTQSGRSTPSSRLYLRGSRTPSLRDPNAHLDELNQIPERPDIVPAKPPVVTPTTQEQDAAVEAAIIKSAKLFHKHKRRHKKSKSSTDVDAEEAAPPITPLGELEVAERETQKAKKQIAERQNLLIDVYDGDEEITDVHEVPEPQRPQMPVYVWEVMYENQRGISLLGKKWYSSNSLLPSDPTAYTLPSELPGVTTISAAPNKKRMKRAQNVGHKRQPSASTSALPDTSTAPASTSSPENGSNDQKPKAFRRRTNDTGYDLKTYQTPSPDWTWLTPWMVNMRLDADEQGFRYNLWFHRRGWKSHAGKLNWWGWVRRREWLRLRVLLPRTKTEKEVDWVESDNLEWPKALDEIVAHPRPVEAVVKLLAVEPLDREKSRIFMQWWHDSSAEAQQAFKEDLRTSYNLDLLSRIFVFVSSRRVFLQLLTEKGIVEKEQADEILRNIFESPMDRLGTSAPSTPEVRRSRSLESPPLDPHHPANTTTPIRPGPAPTNGSKSPAKSFLSTPSTPRTPSFRNPESHHFPFHYTDQHQPDHSSPLKEPSEGDVD